MILKKSNSQRNNIKETTKQSKRNKENFGSRKPKEKEKESNGRRILEQILNVRPLLYDYTIHNFTNTMWPVNAIETIPNTPTTYRYFFGSFRLFISTSFARNKRPKSSLSEENVFVFLFFVTLTSE